MFLLKKLIAPLLAPLNFALIMIFIGLILLWATKRQKAGKIFASAGMLWLLLASYGFVSDTLLAPIEWQNAPILNTAAIPESQSIRWIVVLGGGHTTDNRLPANTQLSDPSLIRLIEGIRLHRQISGSRLLLSGGGVYSEGTDAETMSQAAISLGVKSEDIVLESESRDTEEEARIIKPMIGTEQFILVTSASHMPRALALFRKEGMNPIAAPTQYQVKAAPSIGPWAFYPGVESLGKSDRAIYESLGRLWAKLRGRA